MCKRVDSAMTMVRSRDTGSAIEHRFIAVVLYHHHHRVIASSTSHCRTIALLSLHHHAIVIAPSGLCSIDPISMVRWYDSEMFGSILLISVISFQYFSYFFHCFRISCKMIVTGEVHLPCEVITTVKRLFSNLVS